MNLINNELSEYHLVKYIIVGEAGVGKTSLVKYYVDREKTDGKYMSTMGVDFYSVDKIINEKNVRLHIWDTAGQERFNSIVQSYYKDKHGAFICFALNRRHTFRMVENHIDDIIKYNDGNTLGYVLVGTHLDIVIDKTSKRAVTKEEAQQLAKKYKMKYIEISSRTGKNVDKCFDIMNDLMSEYINNMDENKSYPIIKYNSNSKYCCMKL